MSIRAQHALWLAVAALIAAVVGAWYILPIENWIGDFTGWIARLGTWGILAFGLIYVLGTLVLAPGSVMSIAAGLAFGLWGLPLVLLCATTGAALAFLIARYVAHHRIGQALEDKPKFKAIAKAIDEQGWKVVALVRLSPQVPFGMANYMFGVTDVGFWPFVITSLIGVSPLAAVYVYIGAMGRTVSDNDALRWTMLIVGLVATVSAGILITRKAKEKLRMNDVAGVPS